MDDKLRLKELTKLLNEAAMAYYSDEQEVMSNKEYDELYDELVALEKKLKFSYSNSPTQRVGYDVISSLPREEHETPMLSLDKTKEVSKLQDFLEDREGLLSLKMDGLTIVLTYEDGELKKAITRGNGRIGEVITNNARAFRFLPLKIDYKDRLVIRGEAVIRYDDFYELSADEFKNPRNLVSGTIRQLDPSIVAKRRVHFYAFSVITDLGYATHEEELSYIKKLGFEVVSYTRVNSTNIASKIEEIEKDLDKEELPSDGLVLLLNDVELGRRLGTTNKFPKNALAFKWKDEIKETVLRSVEWNTTRTGMISPVALFDPVELEGSTIQRAALHNVSMIKKLELGIGDEISVYKANMIIPQIYGNNTKSNNLIIPNKCPVCHEAAELDVNDNREILYCTNPKCPAKNLKSLVLFVSRDGMNIEGLSDATIEEFVSNGFIHDVLDIYRLERYKDDIINLEGYGEKSFENLMGAIERSKNVKIGNLIYALGMPGVGVSGARLIGKVCKNIHGLLSITKDELLDIVGIGNILADDIIGYLSNNDNREKLMALDNIIKIENEDSREDLQGINFVITGKLEHFADRRTLSNEITNRGGKVSSAISSKTNYLINNDITSSSSKNVKAKELGIKIISEEDFLNL